MPEDPPDRSDDAGPILVPVAESVTLRNTIAYAVREAESASGEIHFVTPVAWHDIGEASDAQRQEVEDLLDRVVVWAREDTEADLDVSTSILGTDEYLFGPDDYARIIGEYADDHDIDRVVVDPEYSPGGNVPLLRPMETGLIERGLTVEEAPVDRRTRRGRLLRRGGLVQFGTLFGLSFLFYQLLGGFVGTQFDIVTGVASATLVSVMLHRITFSDRMRPSASVRRLLRMFIYTPYLLYEIIKANIAVSYVILHPDLPIEPRTTEVRSAVWGGMPVATLANSITLTPGTLTVRVHGRDFIVHTLIPSAREDLFDGGLERGVRYVFYGRSAAGGASPRERDDCRILETVTEDEEE
ncbi:monovalent cation/H+ antiporter subunit E [Natronomonas sp.]|uniref:monovalent cation/H+ antiporter subunit E n=1 Tax=Natronomonas sp. TaxID=2184060 RepID=UPI002FC2AD32